MKNLYILIILLSFSGIKAQQNVIMEALDAPDPAFTITKCYAAPIGYLGQGLPAASADITAKQQIDVDVTIAGPYNFSTPVINGVKFSKSGVFTTTGVQTLELAGTGIPTDYTVGAGTIAYNVTNGTGTDAGTCNFTRKVYVPDQNYTGSIRNDGEHRFLYKVILGPGSDHWLQTNLGAKYNKVGDPDFDPEAAAAGVNDYRAFGSLFQLGRNSDGHELVNWTSATTATGLSATATPAPNPTVTAVNSGLFYISTDNTRNFDNNGIPDPETGNYYGVKLLNVPLRKYTVGPGDPCPDGFGVAQDANYGAANYNAGSTPWLNNPLKLVAPEMFRNAANGALVAYARRLMRTSRLALFPMDTFYSSEFVIEGGNILFGNGSTEHADRRVMGLNLSTANVFDPRGTLDGYPVRCVKPL
jgi:hypothetical protein